MVTLMEQGDVDIELQQDTEQRQLNLVWHRKSASSIASAKPHLANLLGASGKVCLQPTLSFLFMDNQEVQRTELFVANGI